MKTALVLDANDVKRLIAEKFGVREDCVLKSQYSYTVVTESTATNHVDESRDKGR